MNDTTYISSCMQLHVPGVNYNRHQEYAKQVKLYVEHTTHEAWHFSLSCSCSSSASSIIIIIPLAELSNVQVACWASSVWIGLLTFVCSDTGRSMMKNLEG